MSLSCEEYESLRTQWLNSAAGNLPGEHCLLCNDRGYTVEYRGGEHICVECPCMAKRKSLRRIERSGLKEQLEAYTFKTFLTNEPWQAFMKRKAEEFLSDNKGKWFIACGSVGAGKTHICTAICGELLNAGLEVRYMRWRDDGRRIKAVINENTEYDAMVEPLKKVSVLYIDDLFKTQRGKEISVGDVNLAFDILDARYSNRTLMTIISSEKTPEEIMEIDEGVGSRIYERCKDYCLRLTGDKNLRLRK